MGGIHLLAEMEWKYSTRQLYDMLEVIDVHDSLREIATEKEKAEAERKASLNSRRMG